MTKSVCIFRLVLAVVFAAAVTALVVWGTTEFSASRGGGRGGGGKDRVAKGQVVFKQRCAGCHATKPDASLMRGPSLAGIGKDAATRKAGVSAEQFLLESIIDPKAFRTDDATGIMPQRVAAGLSEQAVRDLVLYLSSLNGQPNASAVDGLTFEPVPDESDAAQAVDSKLVLAGEQLFRGKAGCVQCHTLRPAIGDTLLAPTVLGSRDFDTEQLTAAVFDPHRDITAGYRMARVELADGDVLTGRILDASDATTTVLVTHLDGSFERMTIKRDDEVKVTPLDVSSMPANYGELLSADERRALIAFLRALP